MIKTTKKVKILAMNNFDFLRSPGEISKDIAGRMSRRRKEKKITQVQLAKYSDVSLGSIKRFERTGEISLSSLIKLHLHWGMKTTLTGCLQKKATRPLRRS